MRIPVDILIIDSFEILLLFETAKTPNDKRPEAVGFFATSPVLVSFYKYLFETLP